MKVSPEILVILGLAFLYLLYKIWELGRKVSKPETIFIDTSGITSLKERQYIDIERNKTLNIKVGRETIDFIHLPWKTALNHVEKIAQAWARCRALLEYEAEEDIYAKLRELQFAKQYFAIAEHIYQLVKSRVKKKRKVRKALKEMAKEDIEGIMDITEKVLDYWLPLKKKLQYLAAGGTLRSMAGARYAWKSLELDSDGTIVKKQRFMKS